MAKTKEEVIKKNTVAIHGKDYLTVAGRVPLFDEETWEGTRTIKTEILQFSPIVVIKATVTIPEGEWAGISAVDPNTTKTIEKASPHEVAETSAVGRALGFANYGVIDSIASAAEIVKAGAVSKTSTTPVVDPLKAV